MREWFREERERERFRGATSRWNMSPASWCVSGKSSPQRVVDGASGQSGPSCPCLEPSENLMNPEGLWNRKDLWRWTSNNLVPTPHLPWQSMKNRGESQESWMEVQGQKLGCQRAWHLFLYSPRYKICEVNRNLDDKLLLRTGRQNPWWCFNCVKTHN